MIIAASTLSSAPRHPRPGPLTAPLDQRHSATCSHPKAWLQNRSYFRSIRVTSHSPPLIWGSVTWCLAQTIRQTPTQIPIALQPISAALSHPAVSSPEAYQTPAH